MTVFSPVVWTDGDDEANLPTADDLNTEWYSSLEFLIGNTKPIYNGWSSTGTSVTTSDVNIPLNNDLLKRGNMTHSTSTNNHQVTVPYTGQYQGYLWTYYQSISNTASRAISKVKVNGTAAAMFSMKPEAAAWALHGTFTLNLNANDIVSATMTITVGTAAMGTTISNGPKLVLYYAGEFV